MVSTFTPNIGLEEPARGDDVGTWDTPVNSNMTEIDLVVGAIATIGLNNSNVVLSAAQYRSKTIIFNSTLTGSVNITFPTSFTKSYEIINLCSGTSAFTITLNTTNPGSNNIGCKPGEPFGVLYDGTQFRYRGLGSIGSYWDYAGSSVPNWVSACSIPPYLNCDGSTFSAVTYPALAVILGSTTLPDSRGRSRFALDQGAGRISSAATGFSGSSVGSGGGAQATTLSSVNMPPVPITDPGHTHDWVPTQTKRTIGNAGAGVGSAFITVQLGNGNDGLIVNATVGTGITAGSSSPTSFTNLPPAYIGGITMIRSA